MLTNAWFLLLTFRKNIINSSLTWFFAVRNPLSSELMTFCSITEFTTTFVPLACFFVSSSELVLSVLLGWMAGTAFSFASLGFVWIMETPVFLSFSPSATQSKWWAIKVVKYHRVLTSRMNEWKMKLNVQHLDINSILTIWVRASNTLLSNFVLFKLKVSGLQTSNNGYPSARGCKWRIKWHIGVELKDFTMDKA